jgi:ABC-type cobalamin/Fe3+-siderophores transport system ATPase subunit
VNDTLKTTFGLSHVGKTVVGDAAIRGVSGGEKKRVSIAELLAGRGRITCWDKYALFLSLPRISSHLSPLVLQEVSTPPRP